MELNLKNVFNNELIELDTFYIFCTFNTFTYRFLKCDRINK